MRTIEVTLYQYDELPDDKARERARQWWRDASVGDNDFAEFPLNDARDWLQAFGFDISRKDGFSWSGFWSQGDGASFVGTFDAARFDSAAVATLRDERPAMYKTTDGIFSTCASNAAWHAFADRVAGIVASAPTMTASLTVGNSHYCHAHTVRIECDAEPTDSDEFHTATFEAFRDLCREMMGQIYRELEAEYEYQNSDEYVIDSIRANEYEFTADGGIA